MVMELSEVRSGEADVAVIDIPVPPLRRMGCGVQRLFFDVGLHSLMNTHRAAK